jgi:Peptidase family C25/Right handed beta helix region
MSTSSGHFCARWAVLTALWISLGSVPLEAAQLRSLQSGPATIGNGSSSTTVALAQPVTAAQAFLVFSISLSANTPADGNVSGRLVGAGNQVVFERAGTNGAVTVEWSVAEFATGVAVQRGTADLTAGVPFNQPLAAVNPARSFPILSFHADGININANDFVRGRITGGGTNLELSYLTGVSTSIERVEWQVVEYQDSAVQTGSLVFSDVDLSRTATLGAAVNVDKSWLLFNYRCDVSCPDDNNMGPKMLRGRITNGTTLTFDRTVTAAGEALAVSWYLIEFTDQTIVRSGSTNFGNADTQRGAVIAPVTPGASIVTAGGAYHRGGRTSISTDDQIGTSSVTLDLVNATTLLMRRGATGATADIGWFVVSFVRTNYRSIGTVANYAVNTVSVTQGSNVVFGNGTAFRAANRGRGDRIHINGVNYTVYSVDSPTQLRLTDPYLGATNAASPYFISRQFGTLAAWETCIDGGGSPCGAFPVVPSSNLVADGRAEVGIAYKDSTLAGGLLIDGSTTDALRSITLTADDGNRHYGIAGQGVVINNTTMNPAVDVRDDFVTVEWLEMRGGNGSGADGIEVSALAATSQVVLRNNLMQNVGGNGIQIFEDDARIDIYNNFIYDAAARGIRFSTGVLLAGSRFRVLNNTIFSSMQEGISKLAGSSLAPTILLQNNISHGNNAADYSADPTDSLNPASSGNLSEDGSATTHSPADGGHPNIPLTGAVGTAVNFVSTAAPVNLHLQGTSFAIDKETALTSIFTTDVDSGLRQAPWDIGADEAAAVTAVELTSFAAHGWDSAVELSWETASELDNLGFHLYRALSEEGPYERITSALVPGLGSSPAGARYRYTDTGLLNGAVYFYQLEDVETSGKTKRHGPVSVTPIAGESPDTLPSTSATIDYGDASVGSLQVIRRTPTEIVLELRTEGFEARVNEDGTVSLFLPGFETTGDPGSPEVPVKRTWLDLEGKRIGRILSVRALDVEVFSSMRLSSLVAPELEASRDGTVRAGRRQRREEARFRGAGLYPREAARVLEQGYQIEAGKALLELAPLRWDRTTGRLLLARRLVVRLSLSRGDAGNHRETASHRGSRALVRLVARERGLYRVTFEEAMGRRLATASPVRLSRQGEPVAFHLVPDNGVFGRGSALFFWSEGAALNAHGREAVYELERGPGGLVMERASAAPDGGTPLSSYLHRVEKEENHLYQAALLKAEDPWLWDVLLAPVAKEYRFEVSGLAPSSEPAQLSVRLQGASDFAASPDHHVRIVVNGFFVAEEWFEGKDPFRLETSFPAGTLRDGENVLSIENVGDTGADYSMVMLDRFDVTFPRRLDAEGGRLTGRFAESGVVAIAGAPKAHVLDITEAPPKWLRGAAATPEGTTFAVQGGREYFVVSSGAAMKPEIRATLRTDLKRGANQADYMMVGPKAFLDAAAPILSMRRRQGLSVRAVALEAIDSEFGFGESHPQAIRDFLSYAYHHWRKPAPRYVLLVGDGTYDFQDYLGTGVKNQVPPMMEKTSYLWTSSDAAYGRVNGEDSLPDLAIGRLPAANVDELRVMVSKLLAYEATRGAVSGDSVLIADNPDSAGDFERDADEIADTILGSHNPRRIYLSRLGAESTQQAIVEAFDEGAPLMSYLGHGGIHLWASENIFDLSGVATLAPQPQQPVVLTMNCLNGYFHFPYFNSLAEELVKAEGKGAIAAISPSGLSLNDPAHRLHKALLTELTSGRHRRLGDAFLAAQSSYAASGVFTELLGIYHLFGDPALTLR